jgi:hypothetical protein
MNEFPRVDLQDPSIKPRLSLKPKGTNLVIILLAALLVTVMIAWLAFLGWGLVELLQRLAFWVADLWAAHFRL